MERKALWWHLCCRMFVGYAMNIANIDLGIPESWTVGRSAHTTSIMSILDH